MVQSILSPTTAIDPPTDTYRYAGLALAPVATPTDIIVIGGSATRLVVVKRIKVCGAATAAGTMPVKIERRSTAGTIGSAVLTAVAAGKHDSGDATPTGSVSTVGTANYTTVGTTAGVLGTGRLQMTALATGVAAIPVEWDFSNRNDKGIYLRGILETVCINLSGTAVPSGGVIDYEIEVEEIG